MFIYSLSLLLLLFFLIKNIVSVKNIFLMRTNYILQIAGKASAQFPWLLEKNLEVLALEIPTSVIKTLQAYLEVRFCECVLLDLRVVKF